MMVERKEKDKYVQGAKHGDEPHYFSDVYNAHKTVTTTIRRVTINRLIRDPTRRFATTPEQSPFPLSPVRLRSSVILSFQHTSSTVTLLRNCAPVYPGLGDHY